MSVQLLNESFERKFTLLDEACSDKKKADKKDDKEELHKDIDDKEVLTEVNEEVECDENGCTEKSEEKPKMNKKDLEDDTEKKNRRKVECAKRLRKYHKLKEDTLSFNPRKDQSTVKRPTTVSTYRNKRNPHKKLDIRNDGYGHNSVVQYMHWKPDDEIDCGDGQCFIQRDEVINKTGDRLHHRWRRDNLNDLLDDYELEERYVRHHRYVNKRLSEAIRRRSARNRFRESMLNRRRFR